MKNYKKGDVVEATITGIENYGAFAKIDNSYSGLIHISEISDEYINSIHEYIEIDDVVNVKIIDNIDSKNQLKLSIKQANVNIKKNRNTKIKESIFGFSLLKSALPKWIKIKIEEINKKKS
ncbi:MAG TPA: S1 RNA-binding domain-containing protein [Bacilli bacterium]|nr:S1 RNA-binding domain-containing protein [Bacilli bacterium]